MGKLACLEPMYLCCINSDYTDLIDLNYVYYFMK